MAVREQGGHPVVGQALAGGERLPAPAAPAGETPGRSHPEIAAPVHGQSGDVVVRQPVADRHEGQRAGEPGEPRAGRADPQGAVRPFGERADRIRQPAERHDPVLAQAGETLRRADPDGAVAVLEDLLDEIAGQALAGGPEGTPVAGPPDEPAAGGGPPEAARAVADHVARRAPAVGRHEADAVEPHERALRREPQVAVAGLGDGEDRVLREPLLRAPGLEAVFGDTEGRLVRRGRHAREEQEEKADGEASEGSKTHGPGRALCWSESQIVPRSGVLGQREYPSCSPEERAPGASVGWFG